MNVWVPVLLFFQVGLLLVNFLGKSPFLSIIGVCIGWALAFLPGPPGISNEYYRYGIALLIAFHLLMAVALVIRHKSKRFVGR